MEKLPEAFSMAELHSKCEEKTPFALVALQECERMNTLTQEIRRSLRGALGTKSKKLVHFCLLTGIYTKVMM